MARLIDRLSPRFVQTAKPRRKPSPRGKVTERFLDGAGLYLVATLSSDGLVNRSWEFAYELRGRRRWMGLGPLYDVPLQVARQVASGLRAQLREGIDPLDARNERLRRLESEQASVVTFKTDADAYIALHGPTWSPKHLQQWESTLARYAFPKIGDMPVAEIKQADVFNIVRPHWTKRTATMLRVLNRVERVLDFAATQEHRNGDNPAAHVLTALPKASKVAPVKNFKAVGYQQIGDVMARLMEFDTVAARALRLLLLTATRSSEILKCDWGEVDIAKRLWTIPAAKMKANRQHRIPLSEAAIACFAQPFPAEARRGYPGTTKQPAAEATQGRVFKIDPHAMRRTLKRLGVNATVHGMRAAFKSWATDQTSFSRNAIELSLAHAVALDQTEDAYLRDADLLERRRALMEQWARFCCESTPAAEGAKVVSIYR